MQSSYSDKKTEAVRLRERGLSIGIIEKRLGIPRSTLSGWFRSVPLSDAQKAVLQRRWKRGLAKARKQAALWHHSQKQQRLAEAARQGADVIKRLPATREVRELALAMLYLGEGSKTNGQTTLASSDPRIAQFFTESLRVLYDVPADQIRCHLHLRSDQNPEALIVFWSKALGLPRKNFGKSLIDKRTIRTKTYPHYKGVCSITCGRVAIQRRLMYIANGFCDMVEKPR